MGDNFHCTHCGYRYDFHPGRCSYCGENAVIYDGKGDEQERKRKAARQQQAAAEQARASASRSYTQSSNQHKKKSSGSSPALGIIVLLAICYFVYKGNSAADTTDSTPAEDNSEQPVIPFKKTAPAGEPTTPPSTNNYIERPILVRNDCKLPVRVAVQYMDTDGKWYTEGWWDYEAKSNAYLYKNKRIKTYNSIAYLYATIPGRRYWWKGDNTGYLNDQQLAMMEKELIINDDNDYELRITCNNYEEVIKKDEEQLKKSRYIIGVKGANMDTLQPNDTGFDFGILINSVMQGWPAAEAGLKPGDLLLYADGNKIENIQFLNEYSRQQQGSAIKIVFRRDNESYEVPVTPALY